MLAGQAEWVGAPGPDNFLPATARGSTILRIAAVRRMAIARLRTGLAVLRAETRWQAVKQVRDSRSAGRVATWPVLAAVERDWVIAVAALAEAVAWVAVTASAARALAAAAIAWGIAALPAVAAAGAVHWAGVRPASTGQARERTAPVVHPASAVAVAAAVLAGVVAVVVEDADNHAAEVLGAM